MLDEYKKWSLRAKKDRSVFVIETVAICVERRAYKNRQLLFDFHYASDYVMVGFVFLLELGSMRG